AVLAFIVVLALVMVLRFVVVLAFVVILALVVVLALLVRFFVRLLMRGLFAGLRHAVRRESGDRRGVHGRRHDRGPGGEFRRKLGTAAARNERAQPCRLIWAT